MGHALFTQMYDDAVAVDCRAIMTFLDLTTPSSADRRSFGSDFWESMPADVIMDKARGLVTLGDKFHTDMKRLLVKGRMIVLAIDARTGRPVRVRDPDVIDFDEPAVTPDGFFHMMMTIPDQICSGDQNA